VSKTGPTPDPDAPQAVARRRAEGVALRDSAIAFPPARAEWAPEVRAAYHAYVASDVARAVNDESLHQVALLFEYWSRIAQLMGVDVAVDPEPHKTAQTIRIYDGMATRLANELGIGPLARVRLGIKVGEAGSALADLFGTGAARGRE
jgi:hypothetical protein